MKLSRRCIVETPLEASDLEKYHLEYIVILHLKEQVEMVYTSANL